MERLQEVLGYRPANVAATYDRIQIYGNHPAERWRHECRSEQEDTVWTEQLDDDASGTVLQNDTAAQRDHVRNFITPGTY